MDAGRTPPVSQRNLQRRGRGKSGCDARHYFKRDGCLAQCLHLLSSTAKDQRVATLEPDHTQSFASVVDHQRIDPGLGDGFDAAALADIHDLSRRRRSLEDDCRNQVVMQDDICRRQQPERADGQQFRVTRTRADQVDAALFCPGWPAGRFTLQSVYGSTSCSRVCPAGNACSRAGHSSASHTGRWASACSRRLRSSPGG